MINSNCNAFFTDLCLGLEVGVQSFENVVDKVGHLPFSVRSVLPEPFYLDT